MGGPAGRLRHESARSARRRDLQEGAFQVRHPSSSLGGNPLYRPKTPGMVSSDVNPRHFATGMWAFLLQRVTGLALAFYLLVHILVISQATRGALAFDTLLRVLLSPPFLVLDLLLLAAALYHALNGIRIILFDLGVGIREQKTVFWVVMPVAGGMLMLGIIRLIPVLLARF